ncbi:hypothetical protein LJD47_28005, partial [Escherichia coli]|nr:hypothetical protein [Escherichia coli]
LGAEVSQVTVWPDTGARLLHAAQPMVGLAIEMSAVVVKRDRNRVCNTEKRMVAPPAFRCEHAPKQHKMHILLK